MDMGMQFVSWFDPTVICEVVWTGRMRVHPDDDSDLASLPSSLVSPNVSRQPAKAVTRGKAGTSVMQQTVVGKSGVR